MLLFWQHETLDVNQIEYFTVMQADFFLPSFLFPISIGSSNAAILFLSVIWWLVPYHPVSVLQCFVTTLFHSYTVSPVTKQAMLFLTDICWLSLLANPVRVARATGPCPADLSTMLQKQQDELFVRTRRSFRIHLLQSLIFSFISS